MYTLIWLLLNAEFHEASKLNFPCSLSSSLEINNCAWALEFWFIVSWAEITWWIQHILEEQKPPDIFVSWLKSENRLEK